MIVFICKFFI